MKIIKGLTNTLNTFNYKFISYFKTMRRYNKAKKPLLENPYQIKKYKLKVPFINMGR